MQAFLKSLAYYIATIGVNGIKVRGAGTIASIHALFVFTLVRFVGSPGMPHWWGFVFLYAIAWWATTETLKDAAEHDPSWITVDEWLAVWTMCTILREHHWGVWIAAVALFRVFDIFKCGLVRLSEKLPGAWGVLIDDLVAAAQVVILFKMVPIWHFLRGVIFS